jgi:hypothetical protein
MRRLISLVSATIAIAFLAFILYDATFVDRRPPSVAAVTLSEPTADVRVAQTLSTINIRFSEPVRHASVVERFAVTPAIDGSVSWDGNTLIFTPDTRLPGNTEFRVSIAPGFADLAGNIAPVGLDPWLFRTIGPPQVTAITPGDGAVAVPVSGPVTVAFDRLMDTEAVTRSIQLDPPARTSATWSGETVALTFDPPLAFGTTYTVTIGTEASDTAGNHLPAAASVRFTTIGAGLAATRTIPADGVAGVGVLSPIVVVFDAPIDPDSAAQALRITPSVAGDIRAVHLPQDAATAAAVDPLSANVLLFSPSSPLAPHTTYTVSLAPIVARRGDPGEIAPGRTWSFTTGAPASSAQNAITFLSARGGVQNLWLINPDGSNPRQLTTELAPVTAWDVSGDGTRVVVASSGRLRLLATDASSVADVGPSEGWSYAPRFGPAGRWILAGRRATDGADLGWWLEPLPGDLRSAVQVLGSGAPPSGSAAQGADGGALPESGAAWLNRSAFSPDGRWLLLAASDGSVSLVDLGTDPADPVPVASPLGIVAVSAPAWDPGGGGFLLVATDPGGTAPGLWRVTLAGITLPITPPGSVAGGLAIAGDGRVAVVRSVADGGGISTLAPGGPGQLVPVPGTGPSDVDPAFAPSGTTLVFRRLASDGVGGLGLGIWSVPLAGGSPDQLTVDGAGPRWLP